MKTEIKEGIDYEPVIAVDFRGSQYQCYVSDRDLEFTANTTRDTVDEGYDVCTIINADGLCMWWRSGEFKIKTAVPNMLYFPTEITEVIGKLHYLKNTYILVDSCVHDGLNTYKYLLSGEGSVKPNKTDESVSIAQLTTLHKAYADLIQGPYDEVTITVKTKDGEKHSMNFNSKGI